MEKTDLTLTRFLELQHELQVSSMGADPMTLEPEDLARFLTWNAFALSGEVNEAFEEIGWKPWATSRHVNHPEAMREMVDAWHFFMNILLGIAGANGLTIPELAQQFEDYYLVKREKNKQRQIEGYDGVSTKCPRCHRELSEVSRLQHWTSAAGVRYCSKECAED